MVRLRALDILEERGLSKYWLWKRLGMSYDNFNRMIRNETYSIRYETMEKLMQIFDCPLEELFEVTDSSDEN